MKHNNLNSTIRVALIELNSMFYSPVAWLVLVIFAVQIGYSFCMPFAANIQYQGMGHELYMISSQIFTAQFTGILSPILKSIYLYIPLITMGLMSREYQSGSIKLLYSSPVRNRSIILGKFLAMMVYGAVLVSILGIFVGFSAITVVNFELKMLLIAMFGIYLLILAYSAIGLFMSTLTQYQVVAAIGTLAVLAVLNYIGDVGQNIDFVRNITYWLAITGHTYDFIHGLMPSEDIIYFIIVIALFVLLSIFRLHTEKNIMPLRRKIAGYVGLVASAMVVGYITTLPYARFYYDATYSKLNTLAPESQNIIKQLSGPLTITTYVNILDSDFHSGLPSNRNYDQERFENYFRFKPELKMKYVYYWAPTNNPDLKERYPGLTDEQIIQRICTVEKLDPKMFVPVDQLKTDVDLKSEGYKFIRVFERANGERMILRMFNDTERHPSEAEISSALKAFVHPRLKVAFLSGYGSREKNSYGSRGYYLFANDKYFRQSLLNQGFETIDVDLDTQELPEDTRILVISDLKEPLSETALSKVEHYLNAGGNAMILGDYNRSANMNVLTRPLGVTFSEGVLAEKNKLSDPTIIFNYFTPQAGELYSTYTKKQRYKWRVSMPTAVALDYSHVKDFEVIPVLESPKDAWIEYQTTDFVDGQFTCDPSQGERQGVYTTSLNLCRKVGEKEQRIVICGDADFIANQELTTPRSEVSVTNYTFITGAFRYMSEDQFPVTIERPDPIDNSLRFLPAGTDRWLKILGIGVFPFSIAILGLVIIIRRQRK